MLDLSLPFLPVTDISAGNSWWKTAYKLWAWSKPCWRQRKGLRLPRSWLRISPIISAQRAAHKQSRRGLGRVKSVPGGPSHLRNREARGKSEPSLKYRSKALRGGGKPQELHVIMSLSPHSWVEMLWSGADTWISLLGICISHAETWEPDLHPGLNRANRPPRRLSLLLGVKHHQFGHVYTEHTHVSPRMQGSP